MYPNLSNLLRGLFADANHQDRRPQAIGENSEERQDGGPQSQPLKATIIRKRNLWINGILVCSEELVIQIQPLGTEG